MKEEREDKREQVFDLKKYLGRNVEISFFGGMQLCGVLKGYDQILNLVLDNAYMTKCPDTEEASNIEALCTAPPSTIMCKGVSISSIDLL
ncbi:U6 snRNA-associated Sm-like protein LSm7 [Nematocida sp. AWRm77]|nr:U6 snRNA-associated Sm-like protein LSm7 [Nematocida sp. AWRm77]